MSIFELLVLSVALAMDAFAVSICKGLAMEKVTLKKASVVGAWFGGFQAGMPLLGYFLGAQFAEYVKLVDHWIAFALLAVIGANMIREALGKDDEDEDVDGGLGVRTMFVMAVATSIDALAVGVTFAFLAENTQWIGVVPAVGMIGVTTFIISALGVRIGNIFGKKYKNKAEVAGGVILILLGITILVEDLLEKA